MPAVRNDVQHVDRPEELHGTRGRYPQLNSGEHQVSADRPARKTLARGSDVKVRVFTIWVRFKFQTKQPKVS